MENFTPRTAEALIRAALATCDAVTVEARGVGADGRAAEWWAADRLAVKICVPLSQATAEGMAATLTRAGIESVRVTDTQQPVLFNDGSYRQRRMQMITGLIPDDASLVTGLAFELPAAEIRLAERWRRDTRTADAIEQNKPLCACEHCGELFAVKGAASKGRFCTIECCYAARRGQAKAKKAVASG